MFVFFINLYLEWGTSILGGGHGPLLPAHTNGCVWDFTLILPYFSTTQQKTHDKPEKYSVLWG